MTADASAVREGEALITYLCQEPDDNGNPCQGLIQVPNEHSADPTLYFECDTCGCIGSGPWLAAHNQHYGSQSPEAQPDAQ